MEDVRKFKWNRRKYGEYNSAGPTNGRKIVMKDI
jgi:hypothetical protein